VKKMILTKDESFNYCLNSVVKI